MASRRSGSKTATRSLLPATTRGCLFWQSQNPAIGKLTGVFFVAGETIMSSFQSSDGGFVGSEHMARLAPHPYQARGLFLQSGALVSAWSMELVRTA
jgi:hypothetical protein